ncbi:hypothetical protein ACFYXS_06275 [Streptomyces sp. NPDC002574]|uniref:hypothetical protein n=1 Tax=Streptomyces sp. NPDC002574 TaxID=3364652 RepID=UPI0036A24361
MTSDDPHTPAAGEERALRASAAALLATAVCVTAFTAFAVVTTQDKSIRAVSPWQNDPYDGVVSFTVFLVPFLAGLVTLRALGRKDRWRHGPRPHQMLRGALAATVLIAATVLTDWTAVAAGADRHAWTGTTHWLIGSLAVLTGSTLAVWATVRWALRLVLVASSPGREGDWLDDLPLPVPPRLVRMARQHVVGVLAGLALFSGLAVTTMQAVGEDWTSPVLFVTSTAIGAGGFFALGTICNAFLHIARPAPGTARPATGVGRAGRLAVVAAALGLPAAAVLRDGVWSVTGLAGAVDSPGRFAAVTFGGATVIGLLVFSAVLTTARGTGHGRSHRQFGMH